MSIVARAPDRAQKQPRRTAIRLRPWWWEFINRCDRAPPSPVTPEHGKRLRCCSRPGRRQTQRSNGMVVPTDAGGAVVPRPGRERRMESAHTLPRLAPKRYMHRRLGTRRLMNPEGRIALHIAAAEPAQPSTSIRRSMPSGASAGTSCCVRNRRPRYRCDQATVPPRLLSWKSFELSMAACPDAHYDHQERAAGNPSHLSLATASCNATISCV